MARFVVTKAPLGLAPEVVGEFKDWQEAIGCAEGLVPAGWRQSATSGGMNARYRLTITASNPDAAANLSLVIEARARRWRER